MSYIECKCGSLIRLGLSPNPIEFHVTPDPVSDEIGEALIKLSARGSLKDSNLSKEMFTILLGGVVKGVFHMYECENCGRLAVFAFASDRLPSLWFELESVEYPSRFPSLRELYRKLQDNDIERGWQEQTEE